eukprot:7844033-Alexandrium_andersonii.AAC.1
MEDPAVLEFEADVEPEESPCRPDVAPRDSGPMVIDVDHLDSLHDRLGSWVPQGPSVDQIYDWAPQLLDQILGSDHHGDFLRHFASKISSGLVLETQFSGMGGAEMALNLILQAGASRIGVVSEDSVFWAAADILPLCRKVLNFCHPVKSALLEPYHVFGDLLKRLPEGPLETLMDLHADAEARFTSSLGAGGVDPQTLGDEIGRSFMTSAISLLGWCFLIGRPHQLVLQVRKALSLARARGCAHQQVHHRCCRQRLHFLVEDGQAQAVVREERSC